MFLLKFIRITKLCILCFVVVKSLLFINYDSQSNDHENISLAIFSIPNLTNYKHGYSHMTSMVHAICVVNLAFPSIKTYNMWCLVWQFDVR
jgi:hypothetical protein